MDALLMFQDPLDLIDEWIVSVCCLFVATSCLLHLNSMGKPLLHRWVERLLTFAVGFGASGIAIGPFLGWFSVPSIYEMAFHISVALYAIWHTKGHWMELPLLDRRHTPHKVDIPQHTERRGYATEEEERVCSR